MMRNALYLAAVLGFGFDSLASAGSWPIPEVVLCCSEMRENPHEILGKESGQIVVVRNMGNVVSLAGQKPDSIEIASVEYAVLHGATKVIVLGHSNCSVIKSVIDDEEAVGHLPAIFQVIHKSVTEATRVVGDDKERLLAEAVRRNVLNSASRLRNDRFVLSKLDSSRCTIVAGCYDSKAKVLEILDEVE